jgi:asparagine synthase (glutamine-hydrolysing)
VGEWIANRDRHLAELVFGQPGVAETFSADFVRAVLADPANNAQAAWSLVFYALWHSHHVMGVSPDGSIDEILADSGRG